MKNLLISASALFLMCFNNAPANASGTDNGNATISSTVSIVAEQKEKAVSLRITGSMKDIIDIRLTDDYGTTLYAETVKNTVLYTKKLVMANLNTGTYYLNVTRKMTRTTESMELTEAGLKLNENGRKDVMLPYVVLKDNKLDINCMAQRNTDIVVRLFDNEGKLIMEDVNHAVFNVIKRYDLTALSYGTYIVEVDYDDQTEFITLFYDAKNKIEPKHTIADVNF